MTIQEPSLHLIRPIITECFATDPCLLEKWHIAAPGSLSECVDQTMKDIETFHDSFRFYTVKVDEELTGYFGTEFQDYLNLIFIKPYYRCKAFVAKFLKEIWDRMPDEFRTAVYEKNHPAVQFYSRLAHSIHSFTANGYPALYFTFRKELLCR